MKKLLLILLLAPLPLSAQEPFVGAGVQFVSIPRALDKQCSGEGTRFNAGGVEARAGARFARLTLVASAAFATRGYEVIADCVPIEGTLTERVHSTGPRDATTLDAGLSYQPLRAVPLSLGGAIGFVPGRDSRYVAALLGAHVRWLRAEGAVRLHSIGYEDVRYDAQSGSFVRTSLGTGRETKVGGVLRVVLETR
jgi:hypothetical protein